MPSKLALGTVQFGLEYGINNQAGQVSPEAIARILSECRLHGVDTLDTARTYGTSEAVLGQQDLTGLRVVTKLKPGVGSVGEARESLESSFFALSPDPVRCPSGLASPVAAAFGGPGERGDVAGAIGEVGETKHPPKSAYVASAGKRAQRALPPASSPLSPGEGLGERAVLYHRAADCSPTGLAWADFRALQQEFNIQKIGFSVSYPAELTELLERGIVPDIVQVPFNLMDRRFSEVLRQVHDLGTEVHTRSAFLQGLFFRDPASLPIHFTRVRARLEKMRELTKGEPARIAALCLGFVSSQPFIDKVVVGVDSPEQFVANVTAIKQSLPATNLDFMICDEPDIINPALWKK